MSNTYITTFSGRKLDFADIDPDVINIEDIAQGLALTNRFSGQVGRPYSVAQHSVMCARHVDSDDPMVQFDALMHDAAEAYMCDVSSPLKNMLPDYREVEARLDTVIRHRFNLPVAMCFATKDVDAIMLATEATALGLDITDWGLPNPLIIGLEEWDWMQAKYRFLTMFYNLRARVEA